MEVVRAAHKEVDDVTKQMEFYQSQVNLINEKFGGINSIDEQIKIAKLKEQSVGNLWSKLDTCINSTEGNLQCFKCIELFTDPVILVPCGHPICRTCVPGDRKCPDCEKPITGMVPGKILMDLTHKHNFNKDALNSFKNDKTWSNALRQIQAAAGQ